MTDFAAWDKKAKELVDEAEKEEEEQKKESNAVREIMIILSHRRIQTVWKSTLYS
jgi:hypothetical protein